MLTRVFINSSIEAINFRIICKPTSHAETFDCSFLLYQKVYIMVGTVLVVGATGNIGVSATRAALNTGRKVLAIVRNESSAKKLFNHVGTREGITTAEADVTSDRGVQSVVDRVRAGELPSFQHVYSTIGVWNGTSPIQKLSTADFRSVMNIAVESNFFAYRATVPYLLEQGQADSTWTLMTGAAGEFGVGGVTAIAQGALFSLANVACRELANTNVRFNEVFLSFRVDYDSIAREKNDGSVGSSQFAHHYEELLARPEITSSRVSLRKPSDVKDLQFKKKLEL